MHHHLYKSQGDRSFSNEGIKLNSTTKNFGFGNEDIPVNLLSFSMFPTELFLVHFFLPLLCGRLFWLQLKPWWLKATSRSWNLTLHPWRVGIRRNIRCWSLALLRFARDFSSSWRAGLGGTMLIIVDLVAERFRFVLVCGQKYTSPKKPKPNLQHFFNTKTTIVDGRNPAPIDR